jgi:hypothetical protein
MTIFRAELLFVDPICGHSRRRQSRLYRCFDRTPKFRGQFSCQGPSWRGGIVVRKRNKERERGVVVLAADHPLRAMPEDTCLSDSEGGDSFDGSA